MKNLKKKKLLIFYIKEHKFFVGVMTMITLYALFADDVRVLVTDKVFSLKCFNIAIKFYVLTFNRMVIVNFMQLIAFALYFFLWKLYWQVLQKKTILMVFSSG